MKKRVISLLVVAMMAVTMLPSLVGNVFAESDVTYATPIMGGWEPKFTTGNEQDGVNRIVRVANGVSYNGDNSLYIKYSSDDELNQWNCYVTTSYINNTGAPNTAFAAGNTYSFSFYMKSELTTMIYFRMGGERVNPGDMTISTDGLSAEKSEEGWKHYSTTVSTTNNTEQFKILLDRPVECYVDDITLIPTGGSDIIVNGTLEDEPTFSALSGNWTAGFNSSYPADGINRMVKLADGVSISGSKSLYIKYHSSEDENSWGGYEHVATVKNTGLPGGTDNAYSGEKYNISFYMKDILNNGNYLQVRIGGDKITTASSMTASTDGLTQEQIDAGWKKYSGSITTKSGNTEEFKIVSQMDLECYLDNIVVTLDGDTTNTNLLDDGTLEGTTSGGEEEGGDEPESEPVYTDGVDGWTAATANLTADVNVQKFQTVTGIGHNSNNCMYVEFDSAATDNTTWGYGNDSFVLTNNGYSSYDKSDYTLTMWIKGDISFSNSVFIIMGDTQGSATTDTGINKWKLATLTGGNHINASFSDWTQVTAKIEGAEKGFSIRFQTDVPGLYIDDISLVADDDTTGTNLLTNGTFEETAGGEEGGDEGGETATPDYYFGSEGVIDGWEIAYKDSLMTGEVVEAKIANGFATDGCRSVYLNVVKSADRTDWDLVTIINEDFVPVASTEYTVSFDAKNVQNSALRIQVGGTRLNLSAMTPSTDGLSDDEIAAGWKHYVGNVTSANTSELKISVDYTATFFIDNIVVLAPEGTENLLTAASATFEEANDEGFYAYTAQIFDADNNEITQLTAAQSKATLTAKATVVNYSKETPFTAQLITCVYKGEALVKVNTSDIKTLSNAGDYEILSCDITLPEFSEVGDYTVSTYIWDSIQGMVPLTENVGEI